MRREIWPYVSLCTLLLFNVTCAPQPSDSNRRLSWTTGSFAELTRISRLTRKPSYFSTSHLLAMVGEPELKVKMRELPSLLEKDHGGHDREYSDYAMSMLYFHYQSDLQMRSQMIEAKEPNWQASRRFNSLEVWLYNYNDPPEVIVGGILPRGHGVYATVCFLVEEETVITQSLISRTFKKRKGVLKVNTPLAY